MSNQPDQRTITAPASPAPSGDPHKCVASHVLKLVPSGVLMTRQENQISPGNSEQQLRARVADCEARMAEIAELIAHVRHEVNNPLTGVLGQAQLLLREELSEKTRKRVQTIEDLAMRLRDVVAQLRQVQSPLVNSKLDTTAK